MTGAARWLTLGLAGLLACVALPSRAASVYSSSNCEAYDPGQASCTFTANYPADAELAGYISQATGTFSIAVSTDNTRNARGVYVSPEGVPCTLSPGARVFPALGPPPGTFDMAHHRYTASGPGMAQLTFTNMCLYTVTLGSAGSVEAGQTD
ncbi:MAG TPA: hypothetical protein VFA11_19195 [Acidimicrobiales bacterium]|nr:hypothetical protein [Acidimicrobiales bacterium]